MFLLISGVVMYQSVQDSGSAQDVDGVHLESVAAELAATLLGQNGQGWYDAAMVCTNGQIDPAASGFDPDDVDRLGLAQNPCPGGARPAGLNLSFAKIQNLQRAALAANPSNGYVDYEEARSSLGLPSEGRDFHIRSWPVLASIRDVLDRGYKDPNQRAAYIGDYESLSGGNPVTYEVQKACGRTDQLLSVDVWVDITNNGTATTAFEVEFSVPLSQGTVQIVKHSSIVLPGLTQRVTATLPKTADWQWAGAANVQVSVSDPSHALGSCTASLIGITMTAASTNRIFNVYAESISEVLQSGQATAKVFYEAYDGKGKQDTAFSDWKIEIATALGIVVLTDTNLNNRGWENFSPLLLANAYQARLKTQVGLSLSTDTVNTVTTALGSFTPIGLGGITYDPQDSVVPEAGYVDSLLESFTPSVYAATYATLELPYASGGDVYPDLKDVLNNDLAGALTDAQGSPTLATYNLLVVGSNVDHNAMTSAAAKQAIADWVTAGGFLVVLGSSEQNVQWLQPLFHSAIVSASGGLLTPDATNPLLSVPNELPYQSFSTYGSAWGYNSDADQYFTHVVTQGSDDILAASNAGAFGAGRVLLTSWQPHDLSGSGSNPGCSPVGDTCAALQVLHNFFTYSYRDLYLDYGPAIPAGKEVGVVSRIAALHHPDLGTQVEIIVQVYVF